MPAIRLLILTLTLFDVVKGEEPLRLGEGGTFESREVKDRELRLWRSESSRYPTLEISGDRENAIFSFSGTGAAIGRISRIDLRRSINTPVVTTGSLNGLDHLVGKYMWGVYGWVLNKKEWDQATERHEIYITHSTNWTETDQLIARLTVGDTVYRMHRHPFAGGGWRFKAVAEKPRDPATPVTVDLAPFLGFWRQHEMPLIFGPDRFN